jgi:hypothetical protein
MPLSQVTTFQNIAPTRAPEDHAGRHQIARDQPWPIVSATLCRLGKVIVRK